MIGRPNLYTDYSKESAIFSNNTQKVWFFIVVISAIVFCFFANDYWLLLLTTAFLIAVASWGLNIVSGFAGQINLAHGFFVGIGTYVSAVIGGIATSSVIRYNYLATFVWISCIDCWINDCTYNGKIKRIELGACNISSCFYWFPYIFEF